MTSQFTVSANFLEGCRLRARCSVVRRRMMGIGLLWVALAASSSFAQWAEVAPGISYREYNLNGPVQVFVTRADRTVDTWTIDSMTSLGEIKGGRETVPEMVARCDDSITFDGHRYAAKAAINGDYYDMKTGVALGGQIMSGWFAKRFGEATGSSGFVWTADRRCFLGGSLNNNGARQQVVFADGTTLPITQLNEPRRKDSLALFTPQFATSTGTDSNGVEVLVRMTAPTGLLNPSPGVEGRIVKVRVTGGASPLLFNHIVLSAQGKLAADLQTHAHVGQALHLQLGLKDNGSPEIGLPPGDWHKAYASIGAPKYILVNGKVPRDWEAKAAKLASEGKKHGSVVRDPRTGVAFDDHYVYFFVIDGRSSASVGMTFTEAGMFCKDELKTWNAALQDGGGSSTLWVDGKVRNIPSGKGADEKAGVLRSVANGLVMAVLLPPKKSEMFRAGQQVEFKSDGELRLGPGASFGVAGRVSAKEQATIQPEALNGVFAKGTHWWFCRAGETDGWTAMEQLTLAK